MVKCSQCGLTNRPTSRYCKRCGVRLSVHLEPGEVLKGGKFKILGQLGKGGMGSVYLASQTLAGAQRKVVIKHLIPYWDADDPDGDQKAQRRFEREAATLVNLNHPGIPQIYDYFSESGRNYIVMQLIEGEALDKRLTHEDEHGTLIPGHPYPVDRVILWGKQLCEVLEYLSACQPPVLHHDIKPANVIIENKTGAARLVDFGSTAPARLIAQSGGKVGVQKSSIYGTDGYAALEMYKGQSSPQSDVYSLASTLYHLLTDDDPRAHPFKFPKLADVDPKLRRVLEQALESDSAKRPTAQQFRQTLDEPIRSDQGRHGPIRVALADLYIGSNRATGRPIGRPVCQFKTTDRQVVLCLQIENLNLSVPHSHEVVAVFHPPKGNITSRKPRFPVLLPKGTKTINVEMFGFRIRGTSKEQQLGQWKAVVLIDDRVEAEIPFEIVASSVGSPHKYQPNVTVQPSALDFQSGYKPSAQSLNIRCSGGIIVNGRVSTHTPWIKLSRYTFSGDASLSVMIDSSKITGSGKQQGEIQIEAGTQVRIVPVSVRGTSAQFLQISPSAWTRSRPISKGDKLQFTLTITSSPDVRGSLVASVPWIKLDRGDFVDLFTRVLVMIDTSGLHAGRQYRESVKVIAESGITRTCDVNFHLAAEVAARLEVQPPVVQIAQVSTAKNQRVSLHVSNVGGGVLQGRITANVPWLKPSVDKFTDTTDVPVIIDSSVLKPGIAYRGIVEVCPDGGQKQQIPIFINQVISVPKIHARSLTRNQRLALVAGVALVLAGITLSFLFIPILLLSPQSVDELRPLMWLALFVEGAALVLNLYLWRAARRHRLVSVTLLFSVVYLLFLVGWQFAM